MNDSWKSNWLEYLKKKYGDNIPHGPIKINLGEIDFYIPPLLSADEDSFRIIQKYNARIGIF